MYVIKMYTINKSLIIFDQTIPQMYYCLIKQIKIYANNSTTGHSGAT